MVCSAMAFATMGELRSAIGLLAGQGRVDEAIEILRARADAGDWDAAGQLAGLLAVVVRRGWHHGHPLLPSPVARLVAARRHGRRTLPMTVRLMAAADDLRLLRPVLRRPPDDDSAGQPGCGQRLCAFNSLTRSKAAFGSHTSASSAVAG